MQKIELIENFVLGATQGKASNLLIKGNKLINYMTVLAQRIDHNLIKLNTEHYSHPISENQALIREFGKENSITVIEVPAKEINKNTRRRR